MGVGRTVCVRPARRSGPTQKADSLFHPSKEGFSVIDQLWRVKAAISATSIGTAITSDTVIEQNRKELRRQTGHSMHPARHRTQSHHSRARADQAE
jgi:hypothetical protein